MIDCMIEVSIDGKHQLVRADRIIRISPYGNDNERAAIFVEEGKAVSRLIIDHNYDIMMRRMSRVLMIRNDVMKSRNGQYDR